MTTVHFPTARMPVYSLVFHVGGKVVTRVPVIYVYYFHTGTCTAKSLLVLIVLWSNEICTSQQAQVWLHKLFGKFQVVVQPLPRSMMVGNDWKLFEWFVPDKYLQMQIYFIRGALKSVQICFHTFFKQCTQNISRPRFLLEPMKGSPGPSVNERQGCLSWVRCPTEVSLLTLFTSWEGRGSLLLEMVLQSN